MTDCSCSDDGTPSGPVETAVDPEAAQWQLALSVPVGAGGAQVVIDIELLAGSEVEWSGRAGPFSVVAGVTSSPHEVPVSRGPLDNLSVTSVILEREFLQGRERVIATARITNTPATTGGLASVDLPAHLTKDIPVYLPVTGTYKIYCNKPFHPGLGMRGTVEVVSGK